LTRTTREAAKAPVPAGGPRIDVGLTSLIPLDRALPQGRSTRSATYRITLRGDPDPGTALARDGHQEVRNLKGNTFELVVHPVRPGEGESSDKAPAEFLGSSHYVDSADAQVKLLARRAVGAEKDAWKKALRVERYVKGVMRIDNGAAMMPAGQVARALRGDCRNFALLTAAMCRAEGVPSRVVVGLVYVERGGKPYLGFHAWAEVWVEGRWLGVDAMFAQGGVGAGHVKVADHSWHATASLTPLLPVARVLGKMRIEVVRAEREE
jgi:transglutaminase-like putative cysteine protease